MVDMHSITNKEVGPLSCTRRCFNGIVLIVEVFNKSCKAHQKCATFRLVRSLYHTVRVCAWWRLLTSRNVACFWCTLHDLLKTSTIKNIPLKHRRVQESGPTSLVTECLQRPCGLSIMTALASVCLFWFAYCDGRLAFSNELLDDDCQESWKAEYQLTLAHLKEMSPP